MGKLERARTVAIVLAISFYVMAKVGGYLAPANAGGTGIGKVFLPALVTIISTADEVFGRGFDPRLNVACLAIQISGLGLSLLSAVLAYALHALCKEFERRW